MGQKILEDAGFEVTAVSNGAAALKKLREVQPDLAILDIYMPGYTGLEVCEKIKQMPDTSSIPVLLTVGKLEPYNPEEGAKARAEGVIIKPFEASDLLAAVQAILSSNTLTSAPPPVPSMAPPPPPPPPDFASAPPAAFAVSAAPEGMSTLAEVIPPGLEHAADQAPIFEVTPVPAPSPLAAPAFTLDFLHPSAESVPPPPSDFAVAAPPEEPLPSAPAISWPQELHDFAIEPPAPAMAEPSEPAPSAAPEEPAVAEEVLPEEPVPVNVEPVTDPFLSSAPEDILEFTTNFGEKEEEVAAAAPAEHQPVFGEAAALPAQDEIIDISELLGGSSLPAFGGTPPPDNTELPAFSLPAPPPVAPESASIPEPPVFDAPAIVEVPLPVEIPAPVEAFAPPLPPPVEENAVELPPVGGSTVEFHAPPPPLSFAPFAPAPLPEEPVVFAAPEESVPWPEGELLEPPAAELPAPVLEIAAEPLDLSELGELDLEPSAAETAPEPEPIFAAEPFAPESTAKISPEENTLHVVPAAPPVEFAMPTAEEFAEAVPFEIPGLDSVPVIEPTPEIATEPELPPVLPIPEAAAISEAAPVEVAEAMPIEAEELAWAVVPQATPEAEPPFAAEAAAPFAPEAVAEAAVAVMAGATAQEIAGAAIFAADSPESKAAAVEVAGAEVIGAEIPAAAALPLAEAPLAVSTATELDAGRIAGAVQRVFDRYKPVIVAGIIRELNESKE
jgi:CheY-like chemotaxis protein